MNTNLHGHKNIIELVIDRLIVGGYLLTHTNSSLNMRRKIHPYMLLL